MNTHVRTAPRPSFARALLAGFLMVAGVHLVQVGHAQRYATAGEVVDALEALPAPSTSIATMAMTITSASGHSLTREMQIWSADEGRRQLIKFLAPADVEGSGFLSLEDAAGNRESMIYLPALGRVRRVAGGQEQDAFFGSDFSYEDISGLSGDIGDDFDTVLLDTLPGPVYLLEATAKAGADTAYDRVVYEIPEDTMVPRRAELYRDGELVKVLTISATTSLDAYVLPSEIRMETVTAGTSTTIVQRDFQVDQEIPDEVFTERYLQR